MRNYELILKNFGGGYMKEAEEDLAGKVKSLQGVPKQIYNIIIKTGSTKEEKLKELAAFSNADKDSQAGKLADATMKKLGFKLDAEVKSASTRKGLFGRIWAWLKDKAAYVWGKIKEAYSWIKSNTVDRMISYLKEKFPALASAVSKLWKNLKEFGESMKKVYKNNRMLINITSGVGLIILGFILLNISGKTKAECRNILNFNTYFIEGLGDVASWVKTSIGSIFSNVASGTSKTSVGYYVGVSLVALGTSALVFELYKAVDAATDEESKVKK